MVKEARGVSGYIRWVYYFGLMVSRLVGDNSLYIEPFWSVNCVCSFINSFDIKGNME